MYSTTKSRWLHVLVWLLWFLVVLTWASAYGLPVAHGTGQVALPDHLLVLATAPCPNRRSGVALAVAAARALAQVGLASLPGGAACVPTGTVDGSRLAYARAVWAAGMARLMLTGVMTLAVLVDWVTRAQLHRNLGALPVLYAVLDLLHVEEIINRHCPTEAEVSHGVVAVVLILNRLTAPRALVNVADWVGRTVLTQTLGVSADKFNDEWSSSVTGARSTTRLRSSMTRKVSSTWPG